MSRAWNTCRKIVAGAAFQAQVRHFVKQHSDVFEEQEENKLEYTALHVEYVQLVDSELTAALADEIGAGFDMAAFLAAVPGFLEAGDDTAPEAQEGELLDEYDQAAPRAATLEILSRFTSFTSFKEDMLAAKRAKRAEAEAMSAGEALYFSVAQPTYKDLTRR